MGCCGENRVSTARPGEGRIVPFRSNPLPANRSPLGPFRVQVCHGCNLVTWMTEDEFLQFGPGNLPVIAAGPGRKPYCSKGGFWVPGEAYKLDGKCPVNKWVKR